MDIPKLEGLISAIEEESKLPCPSHANLARLVALALRMVLEKETVVQTWSTHDFQTKTGNGETTVVEISEPEKEEEPEEAPKKRKRGK